MKRWQRDKCRYTTGWTPYRDLAGNHLPSTIFKCCMCGGPAEKFADGVGAADWFEACNRCIALANDDLAQLVDEVCEHEHSD